MRKLLQSHRSHFWEPCRKKLPQKSENIPVRKNMRELKFIEAFSPSKGSPGHVEDKKDTHAKNLCERPSKFISKFICFSKSSAGGIDCILTERQKNLRGTLESFPPKVQKIQVFRFSLKQIFLRKVLWTRETQFSKAFNFFAKSQKISRPSSETTNSHSSQKLIIPWKNSFGGIHNLHFDNPLQKLFTINRKRLHSKSEDIKNWHFLIQISSGQKKCNFENRVKK